MASTFQMNQTRPRVGAWLRTTTQQRPAWTMASTVLLTPVTMHLSWHVCEGAVLGITPSASLTFALKGQASWRMFLSGTNILRNRRQRNHMWV